MDQPSQKSSHRLDALTFPLHGTRLIEASAGTGKTYTIAALYIRLVLGHGNENGFLRPLVPPEILVVTFTNAATQELKERIRNRLTQACAFFRGKGKGDEFLEGLKNNYGPEELSVKATLLEQAALWMDESAIHTIHAWCQRMLYQHAFDSLSLFDLTLEPGDEDLLEEAACDFWRTSFYPRDVATLAELMDISGLTTPLDLLKKTLPLMGGKKNIKHESADSGLLEPGAVESDPFKILEKRRLAIESARKVWQLDFTGAVNLVKTAQANKILNNNKYRTTSLSGWIFQLDSWVNGSGVLPEPQVLDKFSATGLAMGVSKKNQPPLHPAFNALDQMNACLGSLDVKQALISHAAIDINRRVVEAKARLSRMGFNDLLTRLGHALSRPDSRLPGVIRSQFPVAMIDEFQDTDPVQYSSFGSIYLDQDQTGLFMIGDPKQAIYAFRGADIHTYLQAKKDAGDSLYTLEKNYRSIRGMVASVNQMFARATRFPEGAFLFKDMIPFDPVLAQGRQEQFMVEEKEVIPMTLWQMQGNDPVSKTGTGSYLETMAEAAAGEIVRLMNLGCQSPPRAGFRQKDGTLIPICPSDIAVLVRDGNEARAIRSALDRKRVQSVYLSDRDSVFESEEAVSLFYILTACFDPTNERALRTALGTALLDFSLKHLEILTTDELAWETQVLKFKNFQKIWRTKGVLPMVRSLVFEFNAAGRLLATPFGERQLTNLFHLAEMLQAKASTLDGEQGVIRWLKEQIVNPESTIDDNILRLESDQELVRVITIHKSKGLEYPLVFLPFICSARKVTRANTPIVNGILNPADEDLAKADQERLAEDLRMLYVALTRSCFACFLGIGVMGKTTQKSGETTTLHESAIGYLLSGGEMIKTAELSTLLIELKGDCDDIAVLSLAAPFMEIFQPDTVKLDLSMAVSFTGNIRNNWRITSYSGILANSAMAGNGDMDIPDSASQDQLQEGEKEVENQDEIQITPPSATIPDETILDETKIPESPPAFASIHGFPRGPEPGTFLHDILEWAASQGFDRVAGDPRAMQKHVTEVCLSRGWDEWAKVLADWLMGLITVPLPLPGAPLKLSDLDSTTCTPEMEFMFASHGVEVEELDTLITTHVLTGTPRPVLKRNTFNGMVKGFIDLVFCFQGCYFVLDYKSNHLGDKNAAYDSVSLDRAMLGHRYDLQYVLYTLALHRLLKARLLNYDYDRDMGGVVYLFLRGVTASGQGLYFDKPSRHLIETLDRLFQGGENHADL